jgi:hypothetical protein
MVPGARTFIVTVDGKDSDLQRDSLRAAAGRRGMSIVLPDAAAVANTKLDRTPLMTSSIEALAPPVTAGGAVWCWSGS